MDLEKELKVVSNISNGFKPMENLADKLVAIHTLEEIESIAYNLYESETYQIRMVSVFLFGKISTSSTNVLSFLRGEVSNDENWRVQEILAMAFDTYCKDIGYENALEIIEEWLSDNNCNTRRAVSEGLRVWTSRPFFKDNPNIAIKLLSKLKKDDSEYVRKSCGNALRDISKKYPEAILSEIST